MPHYCFVHGQRFLLILLDVRHTSFTRGLSHHSLVHSERFFLILFDVRHTRLALGTSYRYNVLGPADFHVGFNHRTFQAVVLFDLQSGYYSGGLKLFVVDFLIMFLKDNSDNINRLMSIWHPRFSSETATQLLILTFLIH